MQPPPFVLYALIIAQRPDSVYRWLSHRSPFIRFSRPSQAKAAVFQKEYRRFSF